jgi:hypothetical protein
MKTYLLTWNPSKWAFEDWPQALVDMREQGSYVRQWSCMNGHVQPGDQILLKKTGNGLTGIVASGTAVSVPFNNRHWGGGKQDRPKQYIQVKFDRLADYTKGEILPVKDKEDFGFVPQASGCVLAEGKAASLLQRFHNYVAAPVITPIVANPVNKKRVGLSIRLRYQILDRDAHTCRYCGRSSPQVELHVDHIISQASWRETHGNLDGVSDPSNLVTACSDCNLGKSAKNGNPPVLEVIGSAESNG